jgi:hypothetical protein
LSERPKPERTDPRQTAAIERWLREEVVATYDAMKHDPDRGIPVEQVFAELRAYAAADARDAAIPPHGSRGAAG